MPTQLSDIIDPSARQPSLGWTFPQALRATDEVINRLRLFGLRLPPGNRLQEARNLIAYVLDTEAPSDVTWEQLAATHRTVI